MLAVIAGLLLASSGHHKCDVEEAIEVSRVRASSEGGAGVRLVVPEFLGPIEWSGFVSIHSYYAHEDYRPIRRQVRHQEFYFLVLREERTPRVEAPTIPPKEIEGAPGSRLLGTVYSGYVATVWVDARTCSVLFFKVER